MPRTKLWTPMALVCLAAMPAVAGSGFAGGQWRHETRLISADVPGIPQSLIKLMAGRGARTSCHDAAELEAHPEALLTADDGARCVLRNLSMSNGRLLFDTVCTNKRFPDGLLVASRGTYTPTAYTLSTTSTGTKNGKPVKILTTGAGRQIAESCKKPAP